MSNKVFRSIEEPIREGLTWEERWRGPDRGLIVCWEVGRKMAVEDPELSQRAKNGQLPPGCWKGGVERALKSPRKVGTLFYLAQWQGLRGDDLDIALDSEPQLTCTRTGVVVTYTGDYEKYKNA